MYILLCCYLLLYVQGVYIGPCEALRSLNEKKLRDEKRCLFKSLFGRLSLFLEDSVLEAMKAI